MMRNLNHEDLKLGSIFYNLNGKSLLLLAVFYNLCRAFCPKTHPLLIKYSYINQKPEINIIDLLLFLIKLNGLPRKQLPTISSVHLNVILHCLPSEDLAKWDSCENDQIVSLGGSFVVFTFLLAWSMVRGPFYDGLVYYVMESQSPRHAPKMSYFLVKAVHET